MRLSGRVFASVSFLALVIAVCPADDGSKADGFCEREVSEFNSLLRLSEPTRTGYWLHRYQQTIERYNAEAAKLQQEHDYVKRQLQHKDLDEILAYEYLNKIHEVRLIDDTALVEDLGRELLNNRAAQHLSSAMRDTESLFRTFQGKKQGQGLEPAYTAFLQLERDASRLEADAPLKEKYVFEPKSNAFSSTPIKSVEYTIHDWNAALSRVDELGHRLQPIQDSLRAALFFEPKDRAAWLTVTAQLSFLLVAMAGWIKSYQGGGGKAYLVMLGLVAPSMAFSVILVLYSADTMLNLLRQAIFPAVFVLYWIGKEKKWGPWIKRRFRSRASTKKEGLRSPGSPAGSSEG